MGVFDDIYSHNRWGFGSGHGSLPAVTKGYRAYIEGFIHNNSIKNVIDYGCGDWRFSKLIDWGGADYLGLDIVPEVVKVNQAKYASKRVRFQKIASNAPFKAKGDLLLVKDVLQHMSRTDIDAFIKGVLPNFKYALITNCVLPTENMNDDITTGEFRPLDLRLKPYYLKAAAVYDFDGPRVFSKSTRSFFPAWKKIVLLVQV